VLTCMIDFSGKYFGGKHVPIPLYEVRFAKSVSLPPQCYQFLCHLSPNSASKQAHVVFVTHRTLIIRFPSHHLPQGVFHVKTDPFIPHRRKPLSFHRLRRNSTKMFPAFLVFVSIKRVRRLYLKGSSLTLATRCTRAWHRGSVWVLL